jgi:hypothetical protein
MMQLVFPDHWTIRVNYKKKACVYEEACRCKKMSLTRTKHRLTCEITEYLSWAPSGVTFRNEEHHENVKETGNIDSFVSCDSAHLGLNQWCATGVPPHIGVPPRPSRCATKFSPLITIIIIMIKIILYLVFCSVSVFIFFIIVGQTRSTKWN